MRSRPSRDAIKFTVNIEALLKAQDSGDTEEVLKHLTPEKKKAKKDSKESEPAFNTNGVKGQNGN